MTSTLTATDRTDTVRRRRIAPVAVPAAGLLLVVASALAGSWANRAGDVLHLGSTYPIAGAWRSAWSWWLVTPVAGGVLLWFAWPRLVARLRWGRLLVAGTIVAGGWAVALSLADGPAGLTGPLAPYQQYPHDVPRVAGLGTYLSTYARHVVDPANGAVWTVHVGGHPPGALGIFVLLQRIGLGGLGPAAAVCVAGGALAVPGVLAVTRLLGGPATARRAALFVPLAPAALWVATSADALFAGVAAAGICALAYAAARRGPAADLLAALGGLALGCCLFLSYGLALLVVPAVGVVVVRRRIRPLLVGGAVVLALLALAYAAGFDWWHGLGLAAERTRTGARSVHPPTVWQDRPTWYFLGADLAAFAVVLGPVTLAGLGALRRTTRGPRAFTRGPRAGASRVPALAVLPATVELAVLVALVSNLSKGEVERIWLPFAVWLLPFAALAPARRTRALLAVQLGWAVLIALTVRTWW